MFLRMSVAVGCFVGLSFVCGCSCPDHCAVAQTTYTAPAPAPCERTVYSDGCDTVRSVGYTEYSDTQTTHQSSTPYSSETTYSSSSNDVYRNDMRNLGTDVPFVSKASQANVSEIELGRLALRNAQSENVRTFAQQMIDDHGKAQTQLHRAARQASIPVDDQLDLTHRQMVDAKARYSGAEFDREYIQMMISDHMNAIDLFEDANRTAKNGSIREFANETLPTLRAHLRQAQEIQTKLR